jgi:hypothetical protein
MNFSDLYKKISDIDKGITESQQLDECPCQDNPEQPKQQDSVNMNVSINGQGANGIRDLMDILRNIDNDKSDADDILVGEPEDEVEPEISEEQYVDEYANSEDNGPANTTYAIDAVMGIGDDLSSKGKGASKANGGENPWNVSESLVKHLSDLYETVKNKSLNENSYFPGYGDEATWGGRTPYDDDDDVNASGITRTVDEVEIDLPSKLEHVVPSGELSVTYEFNEHGNLELHKVESYDEEKNEMIDVTEFKEYLRDPIWAWIEKYDLDNYDKEYKDYWKDDGPY